MLVGLAFLLSSVMAQSAAQSIPQPAVIRELSPPTYPPLARQARVIGTVEVDVLLRKNGAIESASVVSGNPMLKDAALESARKSKFECYECSETLTTRRIKYSFELGEAVVYERGKPFNSQAPNVSQSESTITITARPIIVSEAPERYYQFRSVRSVKCFYLWRCGRQF
jgi:TonB family protein